MKQNVELDVIIISYVSCNIITRSALCMLWHNGASLLYSYYNYYVPTHIVYNEMDYEYYAVYIFFLRT